MTRDELIARTRQLIAEGERLDANPSLAGCRRGSSCRTTCWPTAWGSMDRYHLAWLMVGPAEGDRPRPRDASDEEAAYVREVAAQKTAALRTSLDAVERQGDAVPGRDRRRRRGAGDGPDARMSTAPPDESRSGAGARSRWIPSWSAASPTPAARPRSTTATSAAPRARIASSGERGPAGPLPGAVR